MWWLHAVADDVYCLGVGRGPLASNVFFVRAGSTWALIDAAWAHREAEITSAAEAVFGPRARPAAILLTHIHPDHSGSARELAHAWDLPVHVHPGELALAPGGYIPEYGSPLDRWVIVPAMRLLPNRWTGRATAEANLVGVARPFDPDQELPGLPGWTSVATPGHTPGHTAYFRHGDRVLITGDAVVTVNLNSAWALVARTQGPLPPPRYTTWNWPLAMESVSSLARLEPETLLCGHGRPMTGRGVPAQLRALAAHAEHVDRWSRDVGG